MNSNARPLHGFQGKVFLLLGFLTVVPGCDQKRDGAASNKIRSADFAPLPSDAKVPGARVKLPTPSPSSSDRPLAFAEEAAPKKPPFITTADRTAPLPRLPLYELKMKPRDLLHLERASFSNDTYPATFTTDHVVYEGV